MGFEGACSERTNLLYFSSLAAYLMAKAETCLLENTKKKHNNILFAFITK
jgi:hypothetical protein